MKNKKQELVDMKTNQELLYYFNKNYNKDKKKIKKLKKSFRILTYNVKSWNYNTIKVWKNNI